MGRKNKKNRKRKGAPEESSSTATVSAADAESESLPVVGTTLQATDDVDPSGTNGLDLKPSSKNTRKRNRAGSSFVSAAEDDGGKSADHADKSCSLVIAPQSKGDEEAAVSFPFPTEPDDHCESPRQAYEHIVKLLEDLGGKKESNVAIYDPYFCNGGVVKNFQQLGFTNVYNRKEDCYRVWEGQLPPFEVLVTNPPYSGNHMEHLMKFVTSPSFGNRPWLLLLPNWVHKKDFYVKATKTIRPFYLVPRKRYVYEPPKDFRAAKKSDVHKKSSPFISMWYVWGGTNEANERLIRRCCQTSQTHEWEFARSKSALRDLRRKNR